MSLKKIGILILVLCLSWEALPQTVSKNSVLAARAEKMKEDYDQSVKPDALILSGKNYYTYYPGTEGHQYFNSNYYDSSIMVHDGIIYNNVLVNYDIYNNELILSTNLNNQIHYLTIDKSRVSYLAMNRAEFAYYEQSDDGQLPEGFYQIVFSQENQLLVRNIKEKIKLGGGTSQLSYRYRFREKNEYYIVLEDQSIQVKDKKDLLEAINDPKFTTYVKERKLKLNAKKASFLTELTMVMTYLEENYQAD